jgi:hypothetical protein
MTKASSDDDLGAHPVAKTPKPSADADSQDDTMGAVTPTKLPPMLENTKLEDVELHDAQLTTTGDIITVAMYVAGIDLEKPSLKQLQMLCSKWKMKRYRTAKKADFLTLIATHQTMHQLHKDKELKGRLSKEEIQGSKMRLLNVIFSIDSYASIVTMNDRKSRPKLDAGGAGNNRTRWAELRPTMTQSMKMRTGPTHLLRMST